MNRRNKGCFAAALLLLPLLASCESLTPEQRVATFGVAAGDQQTGVVAQALAQPLTVRAVDAEGKPVHGARVEWQAASGAGSVTPVAPETGQDGRASANWVLGPAAGEQTVTARIAQFTTTFRATARPGPATTVAVVPSAIVLDAIGATATLQATARDAHGNPITDRAPVWSSASEAIASVDATGLVTARAPGGTVVRATLDGARGEAQVTVQPQPASIALTPPGAQISALGSAVQFQAAAFDRNGNAVAVPASQYVWSSSNPAVLAVNAAGLAVAQANGVAQVRAALGSVIGQAQVVVQQVVTSLVVTPKTDTLTTARPFAQLTVAARDANNQVVAAPVLAWSSSNNAVAIVNALGQVSAVSNGEARIRVTAGTGRDSATITVRLNTPPGAVADSFATRRDSTLTVAAPGVLRNDTLGIPPGVVLSFGADSLGGAVTTNAAGATVLFGTGGSLRLNADGSMIFTPSTGFTGSFRFRYRVQNAAGTSDATVTIEVGVAPVAVDDALATTAGMTIDLAAPGLIANDTLGLPPGRIVSYGGGTFGGTAASFSAGTAVAFGLGGFLRVNADGSMTFTPPTGFTGTITFLYRLANDHSSSDAMVTVTVSPPSLPEPAARERH